MSPCAYLCAFTIMFLWNDASGDMVSLFSKPSCLLICPQPDEPRKEGQELGVRQRIDLQLTASTNKMETEKMVKKRRRKVAGYVSRSGSDVLRDPLVTLKKIVAPISCLKGRITLEPVFRVRA